MGRPLFSTTYSSPTVRAEPEPSVILYEKWTYWNAFDPDSDEFCQNDPVFEAFIDHHEVREGEEQAMIVDGLSREGPDSPASSEGSISERGSPMAVGADDPARMLAEAYPTVDWDERERNAAGVVNEGVSQYATMFDIANRAAGRDESETRGSRRRSATINILSDPRTASARTPRSIITSNAIETLPRTSNITPINIPINRANTTASRRPTDWAGSPSFIPPGPSTPPSRTTLSSVTPSPAPTVTPTILSWPSHVPVAPSSPTPNSSGPLTNPSARMSLAHIAPTLIRVRD